jgi:hypothetical protein
MADIYEDEPDDANDLIKFDIDIGSEYDNPVIEMLDSMKPWYDDGTGTPNHDFFAGPGQELEDLQFDLKDMKFAMHVQTAETWGDLETIAYQVELNPRDDEHIEHFRARILAEFLVITSSGTIWNLMNDLAIILQIDIDDLADYTEYDGRQLSLRVPTSALSNTRLTADEVAKLGEKFLGPTKQLDILTRGTFFYKTPNYYSNKSDWSGYENGWDGLDSNGNPKGTGGTYAGIIGETVFE